MVATQWAQDFYLGRAGQYSCPARVSGRLLYYACTEEGYACSYEKPRKRYSLKSYPMHCDLLPDEAKYVLLGAQLQTQT
jgi:hypothetical protein